MAKIDIIKNIPDFRNNKYYKSRGFSAKKIIVNCITVNTKLGIVMYILYNFLHFFVRRMLRIKP